MADRVSKRLSVELIVSDGMFAPFSQLGYQPCTGANIADYPLLKIDRAFVSVEKLNAGAVGANAVNFPWWFNVVLDGVAMEGSKTFRFSGKGNQTIEVPVSLIFSPTLISVLSASYIGQIDVDDSTNNNDGEISVRLFLLGEYIDV